MVTLARNVNRKMRWHGNIVAYLWIAGACVVGFLMMQHEIEKRSSGDQQIKEVIRVETDQEAKDRIEALEDVNAKQNQIIRALLKARGLNPNIFGGVALPGDGTQTKGGRETHPSIGGGVEEGDSSQGETGGGGTKPKPEVTKPTPRTPTPPNNPSPNPTTPSPPIVTPPPTITPPAKPPIIDVPVITVPTICLPALPSVPCLIG